MNAKIKTILSIMILVAITVSLSGCISQPTLGYWEWHFPAGEWVEVTFTQEMFDCIGSDTPEYIFCSLIPVAGDIWVFQEQDGSWPNYHCGEGGNTLHHILPDVPCSVKCESACTLLIMKC